MYPLRVRWSPIVGGACKQVAGHRRPITTVTLVAEQEQRLSAVTAHSCHDCRCRGHDADVALETQPIEDKSEDEDGGSLRAERETCRGGTWSPPWTYGCGIQGTDSVREQREGYEGRRRESWKKQPKEHRWCKLEEPRRWRLYQARPLCDEPRREERVLRRTFWEVACDCGVNRGFVARRHGLAWGR